MNERNENLESRAQTLVDQASQLLTAPDAVTVHEEYRQDISDHFSIELRRVRRNPSGLLLPTTSYLYLRGEDDSIKDQLLLSVSIDRLAKNRAVSGYLENIDSVTDAITSINDPDRYSEENLLHSIQTLLHQHVRDELLDEDHIETTQRQFFDCLSRGAKITTLARGGSSGDTRVGVTSNLIEGPDGHLGVMYYTDPLYRLAARTDGTEEHTVLEQYETRYDLFNEIANPMDRAVAYAAPEDIERNQYGEIVAVSGNLQDELGIREAERAVGLCDLEPSQLEFIEHAMRRVFNI